MTLRTATLFSLFLAFMLSSTGCKKDDFVNSTMDEVTKLAAEIAETVTKAEDKKKGVADAQKLLDGKKDDLKKKMTELGELRGFQVSDDVMASMASKVGEAVTKVHTLRIELMSETMSDPKLKEALEKLTADFTATITPGA